MSDLKKIQEEYEFDIYSKRNVLIVKGKGSILVDENGKEYIDGSGSYGVCNIGHSNDVIINTLIKQANKLISCPNSLYNDSKANLLQKISKITPKILSKTFLCNSGTETIEASIKFSRYHTGKENFICAMRGFHGRTMGSSSATFNPKYKNDFKPLLEGFNFVPFNNFEKLKEKVNELNNTVSGIILELVQGEGGVNLGDEKYFKKVRELCDEKNILLIFDEVQTGFGRTGKMFAFQHFNVIPDILCLAKAIAGGLPMGAVVCRNDLKIPLGKHGSTFGGNPLVCAVSCAVIDFIIENDLVNESKKKGDYLMNELKKLSSPKIREIRGLGLMIGVELKEKVKPFVEKFIEEGLFILPTGMNVIRLLPPLTISYEELDSCVEIFKKVLN